MRKVPQTEWGKTERRCFHWSTNMRPYQGRILGHSPSSFKFVVKVFLGKRRAQNYEELVNNLLQSYQKLGSYMSLKIHFVHSHLNFFPGELWCSEWWTRRTFRSTHFFNGEEISREMELCYARRLLLDFGKGCPYRGMQATGKTEIYIYIYIYMILFVLNNELIWKRLCRCSVYVVNVTPKQNKSTKHIIF